MDPNVVVKFDRMCDVHDAPFSHACLDCRIPLCVSCAMYSGCAGHTVGPIDALRDPLSRLVAGGLAEMVEWRDAAVAFTQAAEAAKAELDERRADHEAKWDALEEKLVTSLRKRLEFVRKHSLGDETQFEHSQLVAEMEYYRVRAGAVSKVLSVAQALGPGAPNNSNSSDAPAEPEPEPEPDILALAVLAPMVGAVSSLLTSEPVPVAPHVDPANRFTLLPETIAGFEDAIAALGAEDFLRPFSKEASVPTPPPKAKPPAPSKRKMPFGYYSDSNLDEIPADAYENDHWTRLVLTKNYISCVPPEVGVFTALSELDLSYNRVTTVDPALGMLTSLAKLKLGGNELSDWPPIGTLSLLTDLDLGFNELSDPIPDDLASCDRLVRLVLRGNSLTSLDYPTALGSLTALTYLDASDNALELVGSGLVSLSGLTSLDLSNNGLVSLGSGSPDSVPDWPRLATLKVDRNELDGLPSWLWSAPSLQTLHAKSNEIAHWAAPSSGHDGPVPATQSLTDVDLSRNALTAVPTLLSDCTGLYSLALARNKVSELPDGLGSLASLETLDVSENNLTRLPDTVASLGYLCELSVFGNKLGDDVLPVLERLSGLLVLNVGHNALTRLPDLSGLAELEELVAFGNALSEWPESLASLASLTAVYLGRNALSNETASADALGELFGGRVDRGDVGYNAFSQLPASVVESRWIMTEGNTGCDGEASITFQDHSTVSEPPFDWLMGGRVYVTGSEHARFDVGLAEMIGKRPTMEDALTWHWGVKGPGTHGQIDYFGLFDGHAGTAAAAFCAAKMHTYLDLDEVTTGGDYDDVSHDVLCSALESAIVKTEDELLGFLRNEAPKSDARSGTTGLFAFFVGGKVAVANVGDSRAILIPATKAEELPSVSRVRAQGRRVRRLSMDHKPTLAEEVERIRAAKAFVAFNGRVNGNLAVSRALGDFHLKPYVIAEPFCADPVEWGAGDMLVMACDGVWDEVTDEEAADIIVQALVAHPGDLDRAAATLRDVAYARGSTDNISVVVIRAPVAVA